MQTPGGGDAADVLQTKTRVRAQPASETKGVGEITAR
jgi:hypothetical protein